MDSLFKRVEAACRAKRRERGQKTQVAEVAKLLVRPLNLLPGLLPHLLYPQGSAVVSMEPLILESFPSVIAHRHHLKEKGDDVTYFSTLQVGTRSLQEEGIG